ncbi:hypothetical protein KFK09_002126 [Dendrobium nobile]|uniref:Uncharacterized protein n=1 Tax=Dendrobium nobile TaxID=94219 RepID=A0A8T3CA72_DENNO|nr:hypothetical protein KFK09_002126 [Dendrobium nobile]
MMPYEDFTFTFFSSTNNIVILYKKASYGTITAMQTKLNYQSFQGRNMNSFPPPLPSHSKARNIQPKPKMTDHYRLEKVGKDGFMMLEKMLEPAVIDSTEAAKKYGGFIVSTPVPKEQPRPRNLPRKLPRWIF